MKLILKGQYIKYFSCLSCIQTHQMLKSNNLFLVCSKPISFSESVTLYLQYKFEAYHNKDYSVVKTLKAAQAIFMA